MPIRHRPQKPPEEVRHWKFIFRRQIGEFLVTLSWVTWEHSSNGMNYTTTWRNSQGEVIHREHGQYQPEW